MPPSYLAGMAGMATGTPWGNMENVGLRLYHGGGNRGAQLTDANFTNGSLVYGGGCYPVD